MLQFQHIEFLLFLIVIPVLVGLFIYAVFKKRKIARAIGDSELVKLLTAGYNSSAYLQKFILVLLAFGILVIGMANLRSPIGSEKVSRNGIDVMIALDVSKSMLAQDIKPSRLDRAKQLLGKLIDKLDNDRIGIVIFAGKAYLQMPLTGDHSSAKMYVNAATTESVPTQGTVINDALRMCAASFNAEEKKYKAVLLISDGEDHDEGAMVTATEMAKAGVAIYTVGMGSLQGSPIVDEATNQLKVDKDGGTVISKLNEEELRSIAEKGNGKYQLFQSTDAVVGNLVSEFSGMDQRSVTDDSLVTYKSYFAWLLGAALLFLIVEMFLSERRKNKKGNLAKAAATLFFMILSLAGFSQDEKKAIKQGNDAYKSGDFETAVDAYGKVVQQNPDNPTAQYNLGNALYKKGKKEEAIIAYENSVKMLGSDAERSNAYYNKGVVLQNDNKLPECIDAYKKALVLDPTNEDARQNLQKALQQQKEEEKKKNEQQNKKQEQKKEQDKKEPKPQPSKITKKDAAEKLKALMQQEKNLQDKLHKVNPGSVNKPEKDW